MQAGAQARCPSPTAQTRDLSAAFTPLGRTAAKPTPLPSARVLRLLGAASAAVRRLSRIPPHSHGQARRDPLQWLLKHVAPPGWARLGWEGAGKGCGTSPEPPSHAELCPHPGRTALARGCSLTPGRRKQPCFRRELCCATRLCPLSWWCWQRSCASPGARLSSSCWHAGWQQGQQWGRENAEVGEASWGFWGALWRDAQQGFCRTCTVS